MIRSHNGKDDDCVERVGVSRAMLRAGEIGMGSADILRDQGGKGGDDDQCLSCREEKFNLVSMDMWP